MKKYPLIIFVNWYIKNFIWFFELIETINRSIDEKSCDQLNWSSSSNSPYYGKHKIRICSNEIFEKCSEHIFGYVQLRLR